MEKNSEKLVYLLPEGKVQKVEELTNEGIHIAFVGDGVNDALVIALADEGIAMVVLEVMRLSKQLKS